MIPLSDFGRLFFGYEDNIQEHFAGGIESIAISGGLAIILS